jgi:hypothetical protein
MGQEYMTLHIIFENLLKFECGKEPATLVRTYDLVVSSSLSIASKVQKQEWGAADKFNIVDPSEETGEVVELWVRTEQCFDILNVIFEVLAIAHVVNACVRLYLKQTVASRRTFY